MQLEEVEVGKLLNYRKKWKFSGKVGRKIGHP